MPVPNDYLSVLEGADHKAGAAITLRVMAGDKVDMGVRYWYPSYSMVQQSNPLSTANLYQVLLGSLSGGTAGMSGGKTTPAHLLGAGSPVPGGLTDYLGTQNGEPNWLESFYRTYDPQLGRFWQVDPKPTENISTYAGMSNNPMLIFDKLGDTGKIGTDTAAEVRVKGTTYKKDDLVNTLVNEWSKITGLKLSIDQNGNLVNGGVATNRGVSRSARQEVLNLINSAGTVSVDFGSISSQGLEGSDGQSGAIIINPGDIAAQVSGTSNDLNKMTFGLGMTVLHELGHTYLHNDFSHSEATLLSFGTIDETDRRVNQMRRELGANWGQRLSYTSVPFLGGNYIPMTNASLRAIQAAIPAIEHALMQNPMVQANELSKIQMPTSGVVITR